MSESKDVGIIGAGIVGLAHAWAAAKRGHRVTVFERGNVAAGASVRNFGMVWPIGQPSGEFHELALRSRRLWDELARDSGIGLDPCGSIHLAHHDDEFQVLREFAERGPDLGYPCELLDAAAVLERTPAANPDGLRGGLHSPTEACVDPRAVIRDLPAWLTETYGVRFFFNTAVTEIEDGSVRAGNGRSWDFHLAIVCSGADLETLFPEVFIDSGLRRCKLQMLKTPPQPGGWRTRTHLASGLTLRHYANFNVCPTLADVSARIAHDSPELDRHGIHVMISQNARGEAILGDSHEYDEAIEPFDKTEIDDLILRELRKVFHLPDWSISEHWHGIYAKHPTRVLFEAHPLPNVHVCTGTGGAGMTMSFGLADRNWERWE
ncbi:MAG: TIGR03364 family FAD-dependent oxidoreductase [Isosphaeraceae bacterium]|nr:TIGR03364 family FAD-dependent oxidoreductase [Isosphaeraceae bacterium]